LLRCRNTFVTNAKFPNRKDGLIRISTRLRRMASIVLEGVKGVVEKAKHLQISAEGGRSVSQQATPTLPMYPTFLKFMLVQVWQVLLSRLRISCMTSKAMQLDLTRVSVCCPCLRGGLLSESHPQHMRMSTTGHV